MIAMRDIDESPDMLRAAFSVTAQAGVGEDCVYIFQVLVVTK